MIYKYIIDPLLSGLRNSIKNQILPGSTCIDIACGTGDMVFKLMDHCTAVTGVDFDEKLIKSAQKRVIIKGLDHLVFTQGDASNLEEFQTKSFDNAILSLAIHQFDPPLREGIIAEALRVARQVIIADYSSPTPKTPAGYLAIFIEFLAGKQHYQNFSHYQSKGGIPEILSSLGLQYTQVDQGVGRVFAIYLVKED
jgi:ubiquinone/menaquinone biosynthesis C-methylase UbiE